MEHARIDLISTKAVCMMRCVRPGDLLGAIRVLLEGKMFRIKQIVALIFVLVSCVSCDQATKSMAQTHLSATILGTGIACAFE
jgi:hypothetical protein